MTDPFVAAHRSLDERLDEAFRRFDGDETTPPDERLRARLDVGLLVWADDEEAPESVRELLAADAEELVRDTPPL